MVIIIKRYSKEKLNACYSCNDHISTVEAAIMCTVETIIVDLKKMIYKYS